MNMNGLVKLIPLLLITMLTACSSTPETKTSITKHDEGSFPDESMKGRVLYMQCTGGYEFPAHIQRDQAWLFLPEGTKRLIPEKSASGALYSNGEYSFWTKREEATLEVVDQPVLQCRNNRSRAIWEEAKLRGADFRAVGNEPGWHLELSLEGNTVYVGDYGSTRVLFKTPEPEVNQTARTSTYRMNNGKNKITVQIEGKSCHDAMSGELFDTTVTINLDGKKLKGCGRALH